MKIQAPSSLKETSPSMPTSQKPELATNVWADRINRWFSNHWLLTFNSAWGIFVILPFFAPIFMAAGLPLPGRTIYFTYNFLCHQLPERSWFLFGDKFSYTRVEVAAAWGGRSLASIDNEFVRRQFRGTAELGWKVAWSDRMVAMYASIFIFGLIYALLRYKGISLKKGLSWWVFILMIAPLGIDGFTHLLNDLFRADFRQTNEWAVILTNNIFPAEFYVNDLFGSLNSVLRIVTGIIFGFGVVGFLWPMMESEFSPNEPAQSL